VHKDNKIKNRETIFLITGNKVDLITIIKEQDNRNINNNSMHIDKLELVKKKNGPK
jgi:hypothetical protein